MRPLLLAAALAGCAPPGPAPITVLAEPPRPAPTASAAPVIAAASRPPPPSPFVPLDGFPGAYVVTGLPPASRVTVTSSAYPGYACALSREGAVGCWSDPDASWPEASPPHFPTPTLLGDLGPAREIEAGGEELCVATDAVRCLGGYGKLAPPTLGGLRTLSVGDEHACAVRRDGRVVCWGSNDFGQRGTSNPGGEVPGVSNATAISAGRFGSCAVQGRGTLVCWGAASLIPWAPGGAGYRPPPPTPPTALRRLTDLTQLSLRGPSPCLLRRTGQVLCWSPEDSATLLPQNPLPAGSEVRGVKGAIALSGALVVTGDGRLLAIDIAFDASSRSYFQAAPVGKGALAPVVDADGGAERGCAVEREGRVICWKTGSN